MAEQVPAAVKAERNARLLETTTRVGQARSRRRLDALVEVLVDGAAKKNPGELSGRTRCNRIVNFDGQGQVAVGDLVQVRVTEVLPHSLRGALVAAPEEAVCSSR
jgi:tRNA-2-methylthio-N6-dimethylallyladenosine synthase